MNYTALIVAAGAGTRMGLGYNKAYYRIKDGKTILEHSMALFEQDPDCVQLVIVTDSEMYRRETGTDTEGCIVIVQGGSTREESVWNGLQAVLADTVFIHDGARPFLSQENLDDLKQAMKTEFAACLAVPCKDTIKVIEDGYITSTLPRETLAAAQTPQCFRTDLILSSMAKARADGFEATDDSSIVEKYSEVRVKLVTGSYANRKITTAEDL
ncbi:MAG: 2-C-methyl-D-erythritol 4-phosphate cytidylyltransferase [Solobacterium sp.]|nr:2-C-methyl-D-erythritol 4-phosphate cytidylyltransferase [Solobacterium sp.]